MKHTDIIGTPPDGTAETDGTQPAQKGCTLRLTSDLFIIYGTTRHGNTSPAIVANFCDELSALIGRIKNPTRNESQFKKAFSAVAKTLYWYSRKRSSIGKPLPTHQMTFHQSNTWEQ